MAAAAEEQQHPRVWDAERVCGWVLGTLGSGADECARVLQKNGVKGEELVALSLNDLIQKPYCLSFAVSHKLIEERDNVLHRLEASKELNDLFGDVLGEFETLSVTPCAATAEQLLDEQLAQQQQLQAQLAKFEEEDRKRKQEAEDRARKVEEERLQRERDEEEKSRQKREREESERQEREEQLKRQKEEREREEREQVKREKERREKEQQEREKERELKEWQEREQQEREQQEREQQEREQKEREKEREKEEQEAAERVEQEERVERERVEQEERVERERVEQEERVERERVERERVEQDERVERERVERERAEQENLKKMAQEQEHELKAQKLLAALLRDIELAKQEQAAEREAREREERERLEREAVEKAEHEREERERREREERERKEREERERQEREERERRARAEREKSEREITERVRAEVKLVEKEKAEKAEQEKAYKENSEQAKARQGNPEEPAKTGAAAPQEGPLLDWDEVQKELAKLGLEGALLVEVPVVEGKTAHVEVGLGQESAAAIASESSSEDEELEWEKDEWEKQEALIVRDLSTTPSSSAQSTPLAGVPSPSPPASPASPASPSPSPISSPSLTMQACAMTKGSWEKVQRAHERPRSTVLSSHTRSLSSQLGDLAAVQAAATSPLAEADETDAPDTDILETDAQEIAPSDKPHHMLPSSVLPPSPAQIAMRQRDSSSRHTPPSWKLPQTPPVAPADDASPASDVSASPPIKCIPLTPDKSVDTRTPTHNEKHEVSAPIAFVHKTHLISASGGAICLDGKPVSEEHLKKLLQTAMENANAAGSASQSSMKEKQKALKSFTSKLRMMSSASFKAFPARTSDVQFSPNTAPPLCKPIQDTENLRLMIRSMEGIPWSSPSLVDYWSTQLSHTETWMAR
eukprot:TRINITY_DN537_c0_g1_i1.p1 TRINITY_DN537_c0_g1~~TRINITY_DN537_c0_g1_i1.p1  ORF type:complete len:890 (-),score=255.72 TRINITY_DN537_c0_g1_i1:93-2762(-)